MTLYNGRTKFSTAIRWSPPVHLRCQHTVSPGYPTNLCTVTPGTPPANNCSSYVTSQHNEVSAVQETSTNSSPYTVQVIHRPCVTNSFRTFYILRHVGSLRSQIL